MFQEEGSKPIQLAFHNAIVTLMVGARKLGREGAQAVGSPSKKVKLGCVLTEPPPSSSESLIDFCFQLLFFLSFLALVAFLK